MTDVMARRLAAIDAALESFESCDEEVADLVADAEAEGDAETLRAHVELAAVFGRHHESERVREHLDRALAVPAHEPGDVVLRLRVLVQIATSEDLPEELADGVCEALDRVGAHVDDQLRADAHAAAGRALARVGRAAEAEVHERAILAIAPTGQYTVVEATLRLAALLTARGAHAETRDLLEARVAIEPTAYHYRELYRGLLAAGDDTAAEAARAEGHRRAIEDGTREIDARTLAWLGPPGDGRLTLEQLGFESDPLEHSHGRIDDVAELDSERVFGPRRDYTCACGELADFGRYTELCSTCRVECLPSVERRHRLGHVRLHTPIVHPRARHLAAILLDVREDEIDLAGLQIPHLPSLLEDLREQRARGQLRDRHHTVASRLAVVEYLVEADLYHPLFVPCLPIVSPDAVIAGVDPARLRDAYVRLLAANAAKAPVADEVAEVMACFGPLPAPLGVTQSGETHVRAFELPPNVVVRPTFYLPDKTFTVASGCLLAAPDGRRLLVTTRNLFPFPLELIEHVRLYDAFDGSDAGLAGPSLALRDADPTVPARDIAAFELARGLPMRVLELAATDAQPEERVYLAGAVGGNAPASQPLHPATVLGEAVDGTLLIGFDIPDLDLLGLDGAPVLREDGTVIGLLQRGIAANGRGQPRAFVARASSLRRLLA